MPLLITLSTKGAPGTNSHPGKRPNGDFSFIHFFLFDDQTNASNSAHVLCVVSVPYFMQKVFNRKSEIRF